MYKAKHAKKPEYRNRRGKILIVIVSLAGVLILSTNVAFAELDIKGQISHWYSLNVNEANTAIYQKLTEETQIQADRIKKEIQSILDQTLQDIDNYAVQKQNETLSAIEEYAVQKQDEVLLALEKQVDSLSKQYSNVSIEQPGTTTMDSAATAIDNLAESVNTPGATYAAPESVTLPQRDTQTAILPQLEPQAQTEITIQPEAAPQEEASALEETIVIDVPAQAEAAPQSESITKAENMPGN